MELEQQVEQLQRQLAQSAPGQEQNSDDVLDKQVIALLV